MNNIKTPITYKEIDEIISSGLKENFPDTKNGYWVEDKNRFDYYVNRKDFSEDEQLKLKYLVAEDIITLRQFNLKSFWACGQSELEHLFWKEVHKGVAERHDVKNHIARGIHGASFEFTTNPINNVKYLANSGKLITKLSENINNILDAYQEMLRAPEILAKLIINNL